MAYSARVIRDSVSPSGDRLTTMEVTFPRIVLAEFNTHRAFSRNSASSRAIPVEKMLQRVKDDPFVPIYWGRNQRGMQAAEELDPEARARAERYWLEQRDHAVDVVMDLQRLDLHKQIANRLLEPFLWHTVIVTATDWSNFWGLRLGPEAQPEIRRGADLMWSAMDASTPRQLGWGEWHLPLVDDEDDLRAAGYDQRGLIEVCVGRCARVSYLTHDGKRDPRADVELCRRLLSNGHMSPFEHAARPMQGDERRPSLGLHSNLHGWVQARKLIVDEHDFSKARPGRSIDI